MGQRKQVGVKHFEDEGGGRKPRNVGILQKRGTDKELDYPLVPLEGTQPCDTLILACKTIWDF